MPPVAADPSGRIIGCTVVASEGDGDGKADDADADAECGDGADRGSDGSECSDANAGRTADLSADFPPFASPVVWLPCNALPGLSGGGNMPRYARAASDESAFGN